MDRNVFAAAQCWSAERSAMLSRDCLGALLDWLNERLTL